jgi:hypothetical protein
MTLKTLVNALGFGFITWSMIAQLQIYGYCFFNQVTKVTIDINHFGESTFEYWMIFIGFLFACYFLLDKLGGEKNG